MWPIAKSAFLQSSKLEITSTYDDGSDETETREVRFSQVFRGATKGLLSDMVMVESSAWLMAQRSRPPCGVFLELFLVRHDAVGRGLDSCRRDESGANDELWG
jgi:hypothetical protein